MSGSLKEELLKLGLGRRPKPAEPERRKSAARQPQPARPQPAPVAPAPRQPSARETRELERERAKRNARVLEQLDANKLDDAQAEIRRYYSTGRKIKYTYVTQAQQAALLAGDIAIVVVHGRGRLVASSLLPRLREIDPDLRVVDPHAAASTDDNDPEHQVPDDLRW